jgi:Holliday junction resolvase RusA-like endonuclease
MLEIKPPKPLEGVFRLHITAFFQTPKRWSKKKQKRVEGTFRPKYPDTDNIAKIIMDAMNDYIIEDDRYIVSTTVQKYYSMKPCTIIKLEEIE